MVIIGFTGTHRGMTKEQKAAVFMWLGGFWMSHVPFEFHHGMCVGADEQAADLAFNLRSKIVAHPGMNKDGRVWLRSPFNHNDLVLPQKHFLDRNHDIVDVCDTLIATPGEAVEQVRSGTWATIRYARKIGRKMYVVAPDGSEICNQSQRAS